LAKSRAYCVRPPSQFTNLIVLEETGCMTSTYADRPYAQAPYCLVDGMTGKQVESALKNQCIIKVRDEMDLYHLLGKSGLDLELNFENLSQIEDTLQRSINFFLIKENERERRTLFHKAYKSKKEYPALNLVISNNRQLAESNNRIAIKFLISMDISKKDTFICKQCFGSFSRSDSLHRHDENETACQTEAIAIAKQKCYGGEGKTENELLKAGLIEAEHLEFVQKHYAVFDIETAEELNEDDTREQAVLKLLSISLISTFDTDPICFIREDDTANACQEVVVNFINELESRASKFAATVPQKFRESLEYIADEEKKRRDEKDRCEKEGIPYELVLFPNSWKRWLRSMLTFKVYGFNSQRFDTKVIALDMFHTILRELEHQVANGRGRRKKPFIEVLKRGSAYFSFNYDVNGVKIEYCDIMNYLAPTNLAGFLKMTGVDEAKSVYPYQYYKTIAQLKAATEFPEYKYFWSDLKNGISCTKDEYEAAKSIFNARMALPDSDHKKMYSMRCWLEYYNNMDTKPLLKAIQLWFDAFKTLFKVDPQQFASLPSMSQKAMFQNFDSNSPFLYSYPKWKDALRKDARANIVGGLCTNPHRMVDLRANTDTPDAAKYAPNGERYKTISAFDFNSLYPWALKQDMPCGPGIQWELSKNEEYFIKKKMLPSSSLQELQYLMYLQYHDARFKQPDGGVYQFEHAHFRGQKVVAGYDVDGYVVTPEKIYVIEFNGCYHHKPCPHADCKFHEGYNHSQRESYEWYKKAEKLREWCAQNNGQLIVQWGCQFDFNAIKYMKTGFMPRILRTFETNDPVSITKMIQKDELFGFVKADISASDEIVSRYSHLNFPPVTRRETITEDMISDYMKNRMRECERKANVETVVNAWNGKQLLVYTPLLKFYLSLGLKISNVTSIVEYVPDKCFSGFIDLCVRGRTEATGVDETKANTFKVY